MKVFYLSSSSFTDNQMSILKYLAKHHDITYGVIIPNKNSNYTSEEIDFFCNENGIKFMPFQLKYRFRNPLLLFQYFQIVGFIKKSSPDLIYFANFDQLYLNLALTFIDTSKTIIALHDVESHSSTAFEKMVYLSKALLINRFKYFQTFSLTQQKILQDRIPKKYVYSIALPLIGFGDILEKKTVNDKVRFLFFGNILNYKGLDILIRAFKNIKVENNQVELIIAGRCDNWEEEYASLIDNAPNIFADIRFIANNEIPSIFANANYVILPYRDTTQSGPLMIAYNYNIPVITSNAKGFKEFVKEGTTGYSFDASKKGDLERVLENCINQAPKEYINLKTRLKLFTENNFSINALVKKYNDMFSNVVNN